MVEKSGVEMSSLKKDKGHINHRLFNHELFNPMVPKFIVEKSGVEKSRFEKFMVERSRIEAWGEKSTLRFPSTE